MTDRMTTCPTCGKPVDSLRARSVGVRDGKVVAYCSDACARAAETKPTAVRPAPTPRAERSSPASTPAGGVAAPRATPATGVVGAALVDSGPVIEVIPSTTASRDDTLPRWSEDDDDGGAAVRPAASGPDDEPAARRPGQAPRGSGVRARAATEVVGGHRKAGLVIVLVVVIGGFGAFLAYRYLIANRGAAAPVPSDAAALVVVADAPAAPIDAGPSAAVAVQRATEVLATLMDTGTPRIQRVAAAALGRAKDPRAIRVLAVALEDERLDVARLDLAYALGRAGDPQGAVALAAALRSARRDIRMHAGRLLAQLGDPRAIPVLANYLEVTQLRLGVAGSLAMLAEPRAVEVLTQIRDDAKSSPDERSRATIALGIARRADVTADLKQLLTDPHFNVFAASALAELGERAAVPVLVEQLDVPSLRVEAARSLRRVEPEIDAGPHLPALLAALGSLKDLDQVQAAEAILLLAGDVAWSEYR